MRTVSAQQARAKFGDLLGSVYYGKEAVMVEKKGKPVAVVISPEEYDTLTQQQQEARARMWRTVDRIRERNKDKDPDEELAFITEVVEEVRREAYEAEQRAKTQGGR